MAHGLLYAMSSHDYQSIESNQEFLKFDDTHKETEEMTQEERLI